MIWFDQIHNIYTLQGMEKEAQVEDYRFDVENEEEWRKYLKENGFVVIQKWLPSEVCEKYVGELWEIMEHLADGKLDRHKPETQVLSKCYPPVLHGGMIQYIGHSKPQWDLRLLCKPLFERLWKTQDLKTSFDGFCFMNGRRNYQKVPIDSFMHCDQSPTKNYLWSYQGVMTLTDSTQNAGGFVVVPKSNLFHQQYFKEKDMEGFKKNWFLVPQQDKFNEPFCYRIKVNTKAGDFILWDSRTFHCNTVPVEPVLRVCTYICMLPTNKVPEKTRVVRRLAFENRRTSNHHSGDGFKSFPELPRFLEDRQKFQKLVKDVNNCEITEEIMKLI